MTGTAPCRFCGQHPEQVLEGPGGIPTFVCDRVPQGPPVILTEPLPPRSYLAMTPEARRAGATISGEVAARELTAEEFDALGVRWVPVDDPPAAA